MNHIQQSSSSEYESEGALSVMSLPISTLRQRTTARGCSRNPVGQLQEVMMKEQHCLPVYAEAVESVGKYTEYICVVSAKGLSAKGNCMDVAVGLVGSVYISMGIKIPACTLVR